MTEPARAEVDGVDLDAVAAAVRSCPAVDDLDGGPLGTVATYLPGRRLPGLRLGADRVTVQIRGRWNVPVSEMGIQIRAALASLVGARTVDVVVADVAEPEPTVAGDLPELPDPEDASAPWTTPTAAAAPNAGRSSAPTIPTGVEIPPNS